MKTFADDTDRSDEDAKQIPISTIDTSHSPLRSILPGEKQSPMADKRTRFLPHITFCAMISALVLMDAIIPLRNLWFHEALLTQIGDWTVAPSLVLFPGWGIIPPLAHTAIQGPPDTSSSWGEVALLLGSFTLVCLIYLFALRHLHRVISRRFIMFTTLVIGLLFLLVPVVTSPDLYSYIAYARIGMIYQLNPLTTIPQVISHDVVYPYVTWVDQPSAYGPVWTLLTCFFQFITMLCGLGNLLLPMVALLRAWGLLMHLCSVALIWSIGGSLQRLHGIISHEKRLMATLAFAWNPLLLLEACTNAHNDTTLLWLILLAIWFLVRAQIKPELQARGSFERLITRINPVLRARLIYLAPAILLALGTCLKINLVLLVPGLFLYQWLQETHRPLGQRIKKLSASVASFAGLVIVLYAPFWQGGAVLNILAVNPGTSRTINTFADAFSHLYNAFSVAPAVAAAIDTPAEHVAHTLSMGLFILIYAALCWQVLRNLAQLRTIHGLIRWMAITWLFYCSIGSPWFWPWYLITFLGLHALIEASKPAQTYIEEEFTPPPSKQSSLMRHFKYMQTLMLHPTVVRILTFSMLTLYCFTTWGPQHSFVPGLPELQWSYLNGLWGWAIPLGGMFLVARMHKSRQRFAAK